MHAKREITIIQENKMELYWLASDNIKYRFNSDKKICKIELAELQQRFIFIIAKGYN